MHKLLVQSHGAGQPEVPLPPCGHDGRSPEFAFLEIATGHY